MPPITQSGSFMPQTDAGLDAFCQNFATVLEADPVAFGVTLTDAQTLRALADAFSAALTLSTQPSTRTVDTINAKDAARNQADATFRVYAAQIKKNLGVTEAQKLALGIHIDDTSRTAIPAPTSAPMLAIVAAFSGEHQIRFADENSPASRRKPAGAIQMQLNRTIAMGANPDPNASQMVGLYTKQPILVAQNPMDASKTATYFGRWVTRTGLFGPWSLPISMTIAFGGPVDQQIIQGGTPQSLGGQDLKIAA